MEDLDVLEAEDQGLPMTMKKPPHLEFLEQAYAEFAKLPEGTRLMIIGSAPNGTFFIREQFVDNIWNFGIMRMVDEMLKVRISGAPMVSSSDPITEVEALAKAARDANPPAPQPEPEEDEDEDEPVERVKPN